MSPPASNDTTATNYQQAEAFLAVANTLNDLDLTAAVVSVSESYPAPLTVSMQIGGQDVHGVDLLATHLGLAHAEDNDLNYTRVGDVLVYGHPLAVRVYCGRPTSMRSVTS